MVSELKPILHRAYLGEVPDFAKEWRGRACSSCHRAVGEVYYSLGEMTKARREFWQAIRCQPFRLTTIVVLAYLIDTKLGSRFGPAMQRLRWQLPDVPKGDLPLGEGKTKTWF